MACGLIIICGGAVAGNGKRRVGRRPSRWTEEFRPRLVDDESRRKEGAPWCKQQWTIRADDNGDD